MGVPRTPLAIHGARGTQPVSGPSHLRYSGHTTCLSLPLDGGLLIIDAGTGIAALGDSLQQQADLLPMTILFTHVHLDHITGLGVFQPLFHPEASVTLMTDPRTIPNWQAAVKTIISPPFWPLALPGAEARVRLSNLPSAGTMPLYGATVSWCSLQHPQGCLSYRVDTGAFSIVIATDRECGHAALDAAFLKFCHGADLLVHDAQYTPEEYVQRRGWGHSTWEQAAQVAAAAGVKRLVLVSHDPSRTDDAMDAIVANARRIFSQTEAATTGTLTA